MGSKYVRVAQGSRHNVTCYNQSNLFGMTDKRILFYLGR